MSVESLYQEGKITKPTTYKNLMKFLDKAQADLDNGKLKVAVCASFRFHRRGESSKAERRLIRQLQG